MKRSRTFLILSTCAVLWSLAPRVQAQEFKRFDDIMAEGTSYHIFANEGEATVQVLVIAGDVSGIYEIGVSVELDQLVALAGGTSVSTRDAHVTVRLYRERSGRRDLVYEARTERMLTEPGLHPPLEDGDVLTVEIQERQRFSWRDGLQILTSIGAIFVLVERITGAQ